MNNRLRDAFASIRATQALKENTSAFLRQELARRRHRQPRFAVLYCALAALLVCGFGGYRVYATPVSYISVDVNPSIELGLNRLDRVVSVQSYNEDGALVLASFNIKNKLYTEAVEALLANQVFGRYLSADAQISFTVVSDREEALLAGIRQCRGYEEASARCHGADAVLVEEAHHSGLSIGKYQAFLELYQYDQGVTAADCGELSMGQIQDRINRARGESGAGDSPDSNGHGHGHGGGNGRAKGEE